MIKTKKEKKRERQRKRENPRRRKTNKEVEEGRKEIGENGKKFLLFAWKKISQRAWQSFGKLARNSSSCCCLTHNFTQKKTLKKKKKTLNEKQTEN